MCKVFPRSWVRFLWKKCGKLFQRCASTSNHCFARHPFLPYWFDHVNSLIFFSRKERIISRMTIATITHDFLKYDEILNFQVAVRNQFETNFFFVLCFGLEVSGPLFWILGPVWAVRRFVSLVQSVLQWCQVNCHFPKTIYIHIAQQFLKEFLCWIIYSESLSQDKIFFPV